jgi:N6-adenosine-specific RNA methylase IME4
MIYLPPTIYPPYSVLYVDAPWRYTNVNTGGSFTSGSVNKYKTLSLAEIKELPIADLCTPNAVLAFWATVPLGEEPFQVIRSWGFTFKTTFFWVKTGRLGMGQYFRGNVEPLMFAVRGKVKPFRLTKQRNFIELPPLKHSAKPPWFRTLVEDCTFELPGKRLEMFARDRMPGWDATGLEVDGFDIRKLPTLLTAQGILAV